MPNEIKHRIKAIKIICENGFSGATKVIDERGENISHLLQSVSFKAQVDASTLAELVIVAPMIAAQAQEIRALITPIPMILWCPNCMRQHIDQGIWASEREHHKHLCADCGHVWEPCKLNTVGVKSL